MLEPVGKLNSYYTAINAAITKRNHKAGQASNTLARLTGKMTDYDAARARMKKLVEKPSDDTTKLPRAQTEHDEARDIFNVLNDQLISELPMLLDLRIRESKEIARLKLMCSVSGPLV